MADQGAWALTEWAVHLGAGCVAQQLAQGDAWSPTRSARRPQLPGAQIARDVDVQAGEPPHTRLRAPSAVTGLLIEAAWKRVSGVTGRPPPAAVTPNAAVATGFAPSTTATLSPGTPQWAMRSASGRGAGRTLRSTA